MSSPDPQHGVGEDIGSWLNVLSTDEPGWPAPKVLWTKIVVTVTTRRIATKTIVVRYLVRIGREDRDVIRTP